MSHNKIKIGGQSPNSNGEITISLNNLSDVSAASPTDNDVLQYSSGTWSTTALSSVDAATQYILLGQGGEGGATGENYVKNAYATSTDSGTGQVSGDVTIVNGDVLKFYDTSPLNTITGATITAYNSTDWYESITLPAGRYEIMTLYRVDFSASGRFGFEWRKVGATNRITNTAFIGENLGGEAGSSGIISASINFSSSATIKLYAISPSGVDNASMFNSSNPPSNDTASQEMIATYSSVFILKVG